MIKLAKLLLATRARAKMASSLVTYKENFLQECFLPKPSDLLLEEELNHGVFGVVHKGVFRDRPVAVKKIHKLLFDAPISEEEIKSKIEEFKKEADMLETVQHPHVVKSLGAFYDPETREPILVMELMAMDLRTFLKKHEGQETLKVSKQVKICFQIALGLQYLHHMSPPLAHRDLNDKNVLLAEDGTAKIGDLGQSKYKDMKQIYFNSTTPGNISFMPPETFGDKPHYTESVDIFSLGVLAVEVATQSFPFVGMIGIGTTPEVERRANDLKKMGDDHPLKPLVLKCLKDNYKERPDIDHVVHVVTISDPEICIHSLESAYKEVSSLQEELYFAKMEIKERMEHEAKTMNELKKSDEEKRKLTGKVADLQGQLSSSRVKVNEVTNRLLTARGEAMKWKDSFKSAQKEFDIAKKEIDFRIQHEEKITRELSASNEEKSRLQDQCQVLQVKLELNKEDFEQERHDRETAAGRYEEEKEQLLKTIEDLLQNMKKKNDQIYRPSEDQRLTKSQKHSRGGWHKRDEEEKGTTSELLAMNSRLLESNTSQMIAYEKRLKDQDSRHKAEVATLEERVLSLQRENEAAETDRKNLITARKEIEELHCENAERDKQMKSLEEKYQKQKDETTTLQRKLDLFQKKLSRSLFQT